MTQIEYTHDYFLTAAQCNPQKELPVGTMVQEIIDVATEHANLIGVGATHLGEHDATWVLSRIAFEMTRYPSMEEHYSITTWVESFAKFLSERNFEIRDGEGKLIGRVRTTWVAINRRTRRPADISELASHVTCEPTRQCDIVPGPRLRPITEPQIENQYIFRMSDIDFNRHVNSVRYVDLFVNQIGLSTYDDFFISRFEIMFQHEAHFGDRVVVASCFGEEAMISQIVGREKVYCLNRIFMSRREDNEQMEAASIIGHTTDI